MKSQLVCLFLLLLFFPFLGARKPTIVYVTGYWRSLNQQSSYQQVEQTFITLLKSPHNLIVFGDYTTQGLVMLHRTTKKVNFIRKEADELDKSWHIPLLRGNINASGFNKRNDGYLLQLPLMYSKLALMREALAYEQFDAAFLYWVDPVSILANGLGNQKKYLTMVNQFLITSQPAFVIRTKLSPTAFLRPEQRAIAAAYTEDLANKTADCIYFGGRVQAIPTYSNIYQNFLQDLLKKGWAGDEEDTMMLMRNKYPFLFPLVHNISHVEIYQRIIIQTELYLEMQEVRYFQLRDEFYQMSNSTYYHYQYNIPIHENGQQKQPLTFIEPRCSNAIEEGIQTRIYQLIKTFLYLLAVVSAYVSFVAVTTNQIR